MARAFRSSILFAEQGRRKTSANDGVARIDISDAARNAAYLFSVGDVMLAFSLVSGTTVAAALVYGTEEFRSHNAIEAALQVAITSAMLGYLPLLSWRGYESKYWRGHGWLGGILALGLAAGIPAVLVSGWEWTWAGIIAFLLFLGIWVTLISIALGFCLVAVDLLNTRLAPDGTRLVDILRRPAAEGLVLGRARPRFPVIGRTLTGIGIGGVAAFVALFALFGLADERDRALADSLSGLLGGLIYSLPLWAILIDLGRRLSQPDASRLLKADERAPILLLRSFSDDPKRIHAKGLATRVLSLGFRGRKRLEAAIAHELARLGPFIAIGRPGERLPQLGAARAYFEDQDWQVAVSDWIARARLIVMIAGHTPWVQWELRQIARAGQLGKLLLLLPPGEAFDRRLRLDLVAESLEDEAVATVSTEADLPRILAMRFTPTFITLIESETAGEVDYELAIRIATSEAGCASDELH